MPSLPNIVSQYSGASLNIKNLDVVNLETNDVSCDTLTVGGETINSNTISDITTTLSRTQNITAIPGQTTITGDLITTNAISFSAVNVTGKLTVHDDVDLKADLDVGTHTLYADHTTHRVGVNTQNPTTTLSVNGNANVTTELTVGSTGVLYATTSGNRVGINTLYPYRELDVVGGGRFTGNLEVDTNVLYVNSTSNMVGINTSSPAYSLDVVGNARASGTLFVNSSASPAVPYQFKVDTNTVSVQTSVFSVKNTAGSGALVVDPESMVVGINTGNPTAVLDVRGNTIIKSTTGDTKLSIDTSNSKIAINKDINDTYTLDVNGTTRVRNDSYFDGQMTIVKPQKMDTSSVSYTLPSVSQQVGYVHTSTVSGTAITNSLTYDLCNITLDKGVWLLNAYFTIANTSGSTSGSWAVNFYLWKSGKQEMFDMSFGSYATNDHHNETVFMTKVLSVSASTVYYIQLLAHSANNSNVQLLPSSNERQTHVQWLRIA